MKKSLLLLLYLCGFGFSFNLKAQQAQRPELIFQPSLSQYPLFFDIHRSIGEMVITNSVQLVSFDIKRSSFRLIPLSYTGSVSDLRYSMSGDSILIISKELYGPELTNRCTLKIFRRSDYKLLDSVKASDISFSADGRHLMFSQIVAEGIRVEVLDCGSKRPVFSYLEKDYVLNSATMVDKMAIYQFKHYDNTLYPHFNTGNRYSFQTVGNTALIVVGGISKLWDLKTHKVLARYDQLDLPVKVYDTLSARINLYQRYNSDRYLLSSKNEVSRIGFAGSVKYNAKAKRIYDTAKVDPDDYSIRRKKIDTNILQVTNSGKIISKIDGHTFVGTIDSLMLIPIMVDRTKLSNTDVKIYDDLLVAATPGGLKFWNLDNGLPELDMPCVFRETFSRREFTWAAINNAGFFDVGDLEKAPEVAWNFGTLVNYPLEIFMRDFYRPHLLDKFLQRAVFKPVDKDFNQLNLQQPVLSISNFKQESPGSCLFDLELSGNTAAYAIHLFRNKKLFKVISDFPPPDESVSADVSVSTTDVRLKGIRMALPLDSLSLVTISVYAFNSDRVKSLTEEKTFAVQQPQAKKGKLVVMTIAVGNNQDLGKRLDHTQQESEIFAEQLSRMADPGEFSEIKRINLYSAFVSVFSSDTTNLVRKETIRSAFDQLAGGTEKLSPEDCLVIYFSGHGQLDSLGRFYLVPFDYNSRKPFQSSISSTEFSSWLLPVDTRATFVFIDACYSGGVESAEYISGPFGDPGFGQLSYNKSVPILTSARFNQVAVANGSGLINQIMASGLPETAGNLFDMMKEISLKKPASAEEQAPQFFYWGRQQIDNLKLNYK